jgi:hypothetical protein
MDQVDSEFAGTSLFVVRDPRISRAQSNSRLAERSFAYNPDRHPAQRPDPISAQIGLLTTDFVVTRPTLNKILPLRSSSHSRALKLSI